MVAPAPLSATSSVARSTSVSWATTTSGSESAMTCASAGAPARVFSGTATAPSRIAANKVSR